MNTPQYIDHLLDAYRRGYDIRYAAGKSKVPERKEYYFKAKEDLPRVQVVLSFLHGIAPAGQCKSLLDIGSGRGVFLFPLLREFPDMEVTSLDILPHRVDLL
jgi:2-polyprenyl-3-methyl-5-hydroxy-6-metoxy-1,4-benzoquinol methylase